MEIVDFLFRWLHILFGITWIGLLYYFNFIQTEFFKEASPEGLADAKAKLAPRALAWFRWGAMLTLITGLLLFGGIQGRGVLNDYIIVGSLLGILMFLNVWLIIWPKQKIVLGLSEGDTSIAAPKAALASRTNVLFSAPMLFCMLGSSHLGYNKDNLLAVDGGGLGTWLAAGLVLLLQLNGMFGKLGPLASVRGVIHMSLFLAAVIFCLILFL